jgi:hypothetical protein
MPPYSELALFKNRQCKGSSSSVVIFIKITTDVEFVNTIVVVPYKQGL